VPVPAPYDANLLLSMLGIVMEEDVAEGAMVGRLTVTHPLIAGTGFLWAPVVLTIADALCAFGVSRHWPEDAISFTTLECKANFLGSAKEGELAVGRATPVHLGRSTQVWDATVTNESTGRAMVAYRCTQMLLYPRSD
jgi:uncharacterized protein (TIGR00369 family)